MIDLLYLGNGAMMPLPNRWLSSALVRVRDELMLFDCGEGTQIPWRQHGWGFKRLSLICLSHLHADHVAGLPGVLHAVAIAGRTDPLRIVGPVGTRSVVDGLRTIAPGLPYDVVIEELGDGDERTAIAGMTLRVIAGLHRVPVLLYRFDLPRRREFLPERALRLGVPRERWGELSGGGSVMVDGATVAFDDVHGPARRGISLGIATDTRPVPAFAEHFRGVDLLVLEGTYGDDAHLEHAVANKHLTFREAAAMATEAGAERLVLTHFSPRMEAPEDWLPTAAGFPGPVELTSSGWTRTLNYRAGSPSASAR